MALDNNGCTDNEELINWYHYIFESESITKTLLNINDRASFINELMILSSKNGFNFPRDALEETFFGAGNNWEEEELTEMEIEDKWVRKIMTMGWAPIGYSK